MTAPGGLRRCGLDLVHERHPHPDGVHECDGQPVLGAPATTAGASLWLAADTPRPWNWGSLDEPTAVIVRDKIDQWVIHYNQTWAVHDNQLVYPCWPAHPAVAYELAGLYSSWVDAYCGPLANAGMVMAWLDRWLPGFQKRLPGRFGTAGSDDACTPARHSAKWNPVRGKLPDVQRRPPVDAMPDAEIETLLNNPGMPPIVPSD